MNHLLHLDTDTRQQHHELDRQFPHHLFDYEKGTVIPAPGYFFIELKDPKVPIEKDPYLVNGDFLLDPEFAKLREGLSFDLADKRPYLESIEVLNSLITKGYVPRLSYEKNVL